jgi:hypothetical protein
MLRLACARTSLQGHLEDPIDGADLVRLAERELIMPLDQEARHLERRIELPRSTLILPSAVSQRYGRSFGGLRHLATETLVDDSFGFRNNFLCSTFLQI